jgi:hypothetical protein
MKHKLNRPELVFTNMDFLDCHYDLRTEFELITISCIWDTLLSTKYCMTHSTPISTDMEDWLECENACLVLLRNYLTWSEYQAMLCFYNNGEV